MSSFFKKVARFALPVAGTFLAPGIGTALGSTLSGAALGGIGGAIGGGVGGAVGGGGLKSALTGAALGGAGGYLSGGGLLGSAAGTPLSTVSGNAALQGPTAGSGLRGLLSGGSIGSLGSGASTGALGNISSLVRPAATIYGGLQQSDTVDEMEDQLLSSQNQALNEFRPLQEEFAAGFDPSSLTSDPGYQYRLSQGQEALDRSLGAQGLGQSGAAIKAAQEQAQGLAQQQYNDAYAQWLQRNGARMGLAGDVSNLYGNMGNVRATATGSQSNILSKTLSDLLNREQSAGYF